MPHIVVDARTVHSLNDGAGNYLVQIMPRMASLDRSVRYTLLVRASRLEFWNRLVPSAENLVLDYGPVGLANQLLPPLILSKLRPDVYFFPSNTPPIFTPCKMAFTVHDLTPLTHPPYFEKSSALKTLVFRTLVGLALRRASKVISVSGYTKEMILRYYGKRYRSKIDVVHHGSPCLAKPEAVHPPSGEAPFFLYVGTDKPHKNLDRMLDAYRVCVQGHSMFPSLLVAGTMRRPDYYVDEISRRGLEQHVRLLGYVNDQELDRLYRQALALVFPSLAEGFGLPVLEAMARGTVVITSQDSATAEVAGTAAWLVDPRRVDSISEAMEKIYADPNLARSLQQAGFSNLSRFSWDAAAAQTLASLLSVIE